MLVECAKRYIGIPYQWGGQSFWWEDEPSVDCSGFVINVYKEILGVERLGFIDDTADGLWRNHSTPTERPLPGDLVFFSEDGERVSHVAIFLSSTDEGLVVIDASSLPETMCVAVRTLDPERADLVGFAVMNVLT